MTDCLTGSDLQVLGKGVIQDFERRVAAIPKDLCGPFHTEAVRLEADLLGIYRVAVVVARKTDDLESIASVWGVMVMFCDDAAKGLIDLVNQHPHCGANVYYDRVLDLRNKCHRLQQIHS